MRIRIYQRGESETYDAEFDNQVQSLTDALRQRFLEVSIILDRPLASQPIPGQFRSTPITLSGSSC